MNEILSIIKALSDRNRLRIIGALMDFDELCGCQITELLEVTGATASRHLSLLQSAGLLDSRKEGRWIFFCLNAALGPKGSLHPMSVWLQEQLDQSDEVRKDRRRLAGIVAMDRAELCRIQRGEKCCPSGTISH